MRKVLEIRDVDMVFTSGFGGRVRKTALRNMTLAVGGERPSITAIVGESGSGKTTLTRLLLGFQKPTSGTIRYGGKDVASMSRQELAVFRREVQAIFQDPFDAFNPFYRIDHPLLTPLRSFGLASSRREAYAIIERSLEAVGLRPAETLGKYPHELSGGQRQRVMIARALSVSPSIILADEPVSMVDASLRSTILELLHRLNRESGISLVYVTHDLTTAFQIAETIVVLYGGSIMEVGTAEEVIRNPRHPYSQALIAAVPSPDPDVPWNLDEEGDSADSVGASPIGCPFSTRCPHVMPVCRERTPALYRTDATRAAACFLHERPETATAAAIQEAASESTTDTMAAVA
ncbi:ABC transporter ATP-binding protein [Chelativorans sp. J32]|mgnify:CR=1 FL=1|uniref:ABC transporter ATP-binding protein n=1 Tax=Chelativorans sp. J32 TaxID=935840 RepID=UPI0004B5E9CA|nr:ABC transporter ATP-binding protein [Chelativorans sp. J32]